MSLDHDEIVAGVTKIVKQLIEKLPGTKVGYATASGEPEWLRSLGSPR